MKIKRIIWGIMAGIAVVRFIKEVIEIVNKNNTSDESGANGRPLHTFQNEDNKGMTEETSWPGSKDKSASEVF